MDLHHTDQSNKYSHHKEAECSPGEIFDYLWAMSHELTLSLNTILGFTQLLCYEKQITDKQSLYLTEIRNSATLLLDLLNQIRDITQIEHNQIQLSVQRIQLSVLLGECQKIIQPEAAKACLTFDMDEASDSISNGYVIADYIRLKQVILNLFRIAIKHNASNGFIAVKIFPSNSVVRISILNVGKQISEGTEQNDTPPSNSSSPGYNTKDVELTLSISKKLIYLMDGNFNVSGSVCNQVNYIVELPGGINFSSSADSADLPLHTGTEKIRSSSDRQIIVAEDNSTSLMLILNQLESLGYKADKATNGHEALQKIINNNYKLLLTDCHMPVLDGYQLAESIRLNGNSDIAIVALTADAFPQTEFKCKKAGMDDHITKPVDLATIRSTIEKHLAEYEN
jgi:CheY-like chemotaxis protein